MIATDIIKRLERAGFGAETPEEYLNLPENKTDYQRGVVDTLYFLAAQILFLDRFYEGKTEQELEKAVDAYMKSILRDVSLAEQPIESYELVTVNALLQAMRVHKAL